MTRRPVSFTKAELDRLLSAAKRAGAREVEVAGAVIRLGETEEVVEKTKGSKAREVRL
jgi:hypothetical protein